MILPIVAADLLSGCDGPHMDTTVHNGNPFRLFRPRGTSDRLRSAWESQADARAKASARASYFSTGPLVGLHG
ncbi:hypothetical protein BURKHO8Y_270017 [Burkholderia sp. 8Y]|nr:hypothetical protein BURKHO8Y_270017 [Burkholderia sp. 8Y]